MAQRVTVWLIGALLLVLSGCGFALRQPQTYAFKTLYYDVPVTSTFGNELRRYLAISQVELITESWDQARSQVVLELVNETRVKTVVGYSASGQIREYQLRLVMKFRLRTLQGKELMPETEFMQQRSMSYDESYALAKEAEEAMLYRNMQSDVVQLLLRRLAAVKQL